MKPTTPWRRIRALRGRSLAAAAVAGAVVLGGAGWAYAAAGDSSPSYRVAAVSKADVEQTLALSGTLARSSSSSLTFGASGTVSKVAVTVGSSVKRGQVIARLDTTDLRASVSAAEAKVANAKATLSSDKQAQVDAAEAEADAEAATAAAKASAAKAKKQAAAQAKKQAAASAAAAAKLRQQQEAVTSAQTAATKALAQASDALATQEKACASAYTLTDPTDPTSVDASATQACTDALEDVSDAQTTAQAAQATLQKSLSTLSRTIGGSGGAGGSAGGSSAGAQSGGSGGSTSGSAGGSTSGSGGGREVTAATLASDQASIDQAEADLITAQQDLDGAVLTAPTAGTIGALDLAVGDTASSGTSIGTLLGTGTVTVTLGVSATQAAELAANQVAEVLPAGAEKALAAHVTRVSHVASSDSTGSSTYAVLVTLDDGDTTLPDGGTAAVDVVVGTANDVLTVPTSAVSSGSVMVLSHGTTTRTRITTGLVGASRTQITDGLKAGEEVVLADLDAALPTSSTSTTTRGFGSAGGAGFGGAGGGFTGGGFGGGGR